MNIREIAEQLTELLDDVVSNEPHCYSENTHKLLRCAKKALGEPYGPTVRVRIAVAVDDKGNYQASGWKEKGRDQPGCDDLNSAVLDFLFGVDEEVGPHHVVFVTADVPLPQVSQVQGEVEA